MPILESQVVPDGMAYADSFASYGVMGISTFRHRRIDHDKTFVAGKCRKRHAGSIEGFCNREKCHLRRYNGIPRKHFYYFSKNVSRVRREPQGASSPTPRMPW